MGDPATEEDKAARRRRLARKLATGLILGSAGLYAGSLALQAGTYAKFQRALAKSKDWITVEQAAKSGYIPQKSIVFRDGPLSPVARIGERIKQLMGIGNTRGAERSVFYNNTFGWPAFYFGGKLSDPVNARVVRHEGGHAKAQLSRGHRMDYVNETLNAKNKAGGWLDLFNPGKTHFKDGRRTLVGLESEAWDLGGVGANDPIRRAALNTYKVHTATRSLDRYLKLTAAVGGVSGLYGMHGNSVEKREKDKNPALA